MESNSGKGTHAGRYHTHRREFRGDGNIWWAIPRRISSSWARIMWYICDSVERSGLVSEDKIRKWAAKNAYTLIFVSFMFLITWGLIVVAVWFVMESYA